MDDKTQKLLLSAKHEKKDIIAGMHSEDFKDIEKKWNVHIPFNYNDLRRYKE